MAAAMFARAAQGRYRTISAGTQPAAEVHPVVRQALAEVGIDLGPLAPTLLSPELASQADVLVTMGCGEGCPVVPGVRRYDWPLEDPKGALLATVRAIRDDIESRVTSLLAALDSSSN